MIRKATIALLAVLFLGMSSMCYADNIVNVDVNAQIPDMLELSSWIKYFMDENQTPLGDAESFDFETLTHTLEGGGEAGVWFSRKWFTIYLVANTGGRRYQLKQTCTGVTSGGNDINSAFVVTPNYSEYDELGGVPQGPIPGTIGVPNLAVSTDHVLYTSDTGGLARIIQGIYAIPNESEVTGYESISFDTPQGVYGGEVVLTAVLY